MKKGGATLKTLSRTRRAVLAVAVLIVMVGAGFGTAALVPRHRAVPVTVTPPGPKRETPTYATVLPKGKTIDTYGGWTRVSPPDRNPVYAYVDTIGDTRVIVSEQQLPGDFQADPDAKTKELADTYNAKTQLAVGSTTVYTGISTGGVESIIFHLPSLLILIKANASVDDAALKEYVNALI